MAETSNEKSAARTALISLARVYPTRRSDRGFADDWLRALCEGYDNLEMELRCRLRSGERRDAEVRYDNAAAIRLLGMHPTNAERGRALRHHDDQAVLDSIDAMIRDMRDRAAANAVILAGTRAIALPDRSRNHSDMSLSPTAES